MSRGNAFGTQLILDIVFLRAWYSIEPKKLYNPVTSLLLSDKGGWKGMRLTGQIRREEGIETPSNPDSKYQVSFQVDLQHCGEVGSDCIRKTSPSICSRIYRPQSSPRSHC